MNVFKKVMTLAVVALATLAMAATASATPPEACGGQRVMKPEPIVTKTMKVVAIPVSGMTCDGCAWQIANALEDITGIAKATVTHASKTATVMFEPGQISIEAIIAAIKKTGYRTGEPGKAAPARQA